MPIYRTPGDYRSLLCYQKAEAIYDITFYLCHKYLSKGDRTVDQMVQAARSGKQNLAEGAAGGVTRAETEIQLTNVAKASLKELLEDYIDYLRVRGKTRWSEGSVEYEAMRKVGREHNDSAYYRNLIATRPPETIANIAIILLFQVDYLLAKLLESLAGSAVSARTLSGRMADAREDRDLARRDYQLHGPSCPKCGGWMNLTAAAKGGKEWICQKYFVPGPARCDGKAPFDPNGVRERIRRT